jgi:hypothetical protein
MISDAKNATRQLVGARQTAAHYKRSAHEKLSPRDKAVVAAPQRCAVDGDWTHG